MSCQIKVMHMLDVWCPYGEEKKPYVDQIRNNFQLSRISPFQFLFASPFSFVLF